MGLIKNVLSTALGGDQVNNGLSGGLSSARNRFSSSSGQYPSSSQYQYSSSPSGQGQRYSTYSNNSDDYGGRDGYGARDVYTGRDGYARDVRVQNRSPNYAPALPPRSPSRYNNAYEPYSPDDGVYNNNNYQVSRGPPPSYAQQDRTRYNNNNDDYNDYQVRFRPLALPQISHGDGQPFLRGYSTELQQYNISFGEFMRTLDALNVAMIPNPENQIFQKGANIAGWFVPGAAGIGLMAGQIGVGIGTAMGHSSAIAKVLSKANLELFLPNGLELCNGKSKDIDNEVGISSNGGLGLGAQPENRIAFYGNLLAPLSDVLPPLQNGGGRSDPLAMLGQRFADKDNDKKMRRAQKKMDKGKMDKVVALDGSLQWVMVRRASPSAMDHWQGMQRQSDVAQRQEQQSVRR